jgi:PhnB protein
MAQPIPDGMHSITPHLVCKDAAAAMDFYVRAFGGSKEFSLPGPDGRIIHGCVRIGDSRIFLVDEFPEMGARGPISLGGTAVTLHHQVIDVDASMARAVAAGATLVKAAEDMFWGDRYGVVVDPFGHQWSLATHKVDLTPQQIVQAMHQAMPGG